MKTPFPQLVVISLRYTNPAKHLPCGVTTIREAYLIAFRVPVEPLGQ
jgi:hypothetical protein